MSPERCVYHPYFLLFHLPLNVAFKDQRERQAWNGRSVPAHPELQQREPLADTWDGACHQPTPYPPHATPGTEAGGQGWRCAPGGCPSGRRGGPGRSCRSVYQTKGRPGSAPPSVWLRGAGGEGQTRKEQTEGFHRRLTHLRPCRPWRPAGLRTWWTGPRGRAWARRRHPGCRSPGGSPSLWREAEVSFRGWGLGAAWSRGSGPGLPWVRPQRRRRQNT